MRWLLMAAVLAACGGCRGWSTAGDAPPATVPAASDPAEETAIAPPDSPPAELGAFVPRFAAEKPQRLSMPVPILPPSPAWDSLAGGWVRARVSIDEQGRVTAAELLAATHPALIGPTLAALREARYRPVRDPSGNAVQVDFVDRVDF